jgi:hypothetical protein
MEEGETAEPRRGGRVVPFPAVARTPSLPAQITFDRAELRLILNLYGRMVAAGEWRDYAISFERERAVFSVYRRTSESPLYQIVKDPRLARRQGAYAATNAVGLVLKRGHELDRVLRVLEPQLRVVPG